MDIVDLKEESDIWAADWSEIINGVGWYINAPPPLEHQFFEMPSPESLPEEAAKIWSRPMRAEESSVVVSDLDAQFSSWTPWKSFDFGSDLIFNTSAVSGSAEELPSTSSVVSISPADQCKSKAAVGEQQKHEKGNSVPEEVPLSRSPSPGPSTYSTIALRPRPVSVGAVNTTAATSHSKPNVTKKRKKLEIHITPKKDYNFSKMPIRFFIEVLNLPAGVVLKTKMLKVTVTPPSKLQAFDASIKYYDVTSKLFQGCFLATEEFGHYKVEATISTQIEDQAQLPSTANRQKYKQTLKSLSLVKGCQLFLVHKNYIFDRSWSRTFQLDILKPAKYFKDVWGLSCDKKSDKIFYTVGSSQKIVCVDPFVSDTGKVIYQLGQRSKRSVFPKGICCDAHSGRLIVCENGRNRVSFYGLNTGEYIGSFSPASCAFYPDDVDISESGHKIVVTDSTCGRVHVFNRDGRPLGESSFLEALGVACYGEKILVGRGIKAGGISEGEFKQDLCFTKRNMVPNIYNFNLFPQGLVADSTGCLLVADIRTDSVRDFAITSPDLQQLSLIYDTGGNILDQPVNVATMRDGKLVVLETSGRVSIF